MNQIIDKSSLMSSAVANAMKAPKGTKKVKINMEFITDTQKIMRHITLHKNRSVTIHEFAAENIK